MAERGATLVPPYDDPLIIAGQGTIGTEIVEDLAALGLAPEIVVIGASGGGLAAGVSLGVKARVPAAKFYTVEPEGFDDTARSFKSGKREANPRLSGSICDALMSNTPGELTFPITQALIGEGLVVSDAEVALAVRYAFEELKLAVEPGGVIGLAALLAGKLGRAAARWWSAFCRAAISMPNCLPRLSANSRRPPLLRKQSQPLVGAQRHQGGERIGSR